MKPIKLFPFFGLILISSIGIAQDCSNSTFQMDMVTPRATVRHSPSGSFWFDGTEGKFDINDPELSTNPTSVAFAGGFWLGGLDSGGNLKMSASTYGAATGKTDWWPGPLNGDGQVEAETCSDFDRIWQVKKSEIESFKADFNDNGIVDGPVPFPVMTWPGENNPYIKNHLGFELPVDQRLAPFIDRNNDGVYDPLRGDYPFTKGAEVAQWWIINDNGNLHTESDGDAVKANVSFLAYSFDEDQSAPTTIFYDVEITNRSSEPIVDLHAGLWMDPTLGIWCDDYIGSIPDKGLAFVYKSRLPDGLSDCFDSNIFNVGTPLFGVNFLKGFNGTDGTDLGLSSFIYYNSNAVGGPWPQGTTDPTTSEEYYNYLRGLFRDGSPITFGGSGYEPAGDITNYVFPDAPNEVGGWSMCQEEFPQGYLRVILGTGPVDLQPGQRSTLAFAAIVTGKVEHPCPDISTLEDAADAAQDVYDNLPTSVKTVVPTIDVFISPNPAAELINIKLDSAEKIAALQLINAQGQVVFQESNINESQYQLLRNDLGPGIYILEVKNEKGNVGVEKVVFYE